MFGFCVCLCVVVSLPWLCVDAQAAHKLYIRRFQGKVIRCRRRRRQAMR